VGESEASACPQNRDLRSLWQELCSRLTRTRGMEASVRVESIRWRRHTQSTKRSRQSAASTGSRGEPSSTRCEDAQSVSPGFTERMEQGIRDAAESVKPDVHALLDVAARRASRSRVLRTVSNPHHSQRLQLRGEWNFLRSHDMADWRHGLWRASHTMNRRPYHLSRHHNRSIKTFISAVREHVRRVHR